MHSPSIYMISGSALHPITRYCNSLVRLHDVTLTVSDVERQLACMNPYSSMGLDGVDFRILKEAVSAFALHLLECIKVHSFQVSLN